MLASKNVVTILLIVVVFGLVSLLNGVATWYQANSAWLNLNTDHENIGVMFYKRSNPDLFSTDYFFNDDRYFAYYTPSFLSFVDLTTSLTGDYVHAVALLQAPVLLIYLAGAYALFWQVSKSRVIGIIFGLFSIIGINALLDYWLLNGLFTMLPRTMALPAVVWAAFFLMRYLDPKTEGWFNGKALWHWLIVGLLLGVTANLHPTTGVSFAIVVGTVALARWVRNRRPGLLSIVAMVIGTLLAAAPIVANVVGGSSRPPGLTSADFYTFVDAFEWRVTILPRSVDRLAPFSDEAQYFIALIWLPLTLVFWFLAKTNRRSWAGPVFVFIQLAYAWLLIKNIDESFDVLLVFIAALFYLWRWWVKDEEQEMTLYEMLAAVTGVALFLLFFLRVLWLNFEVWSFSTIIAELTRAARLYTLPFYLISARFAFQLARRPHTRDEIWLQMMALLSILVSLSVWHGVLLLALIFRERILSWRQTRPAYEAAWSGVITSISVYVVYQIVTRVDPTLLAVIVGAVVALVTYILSRLRLTTPAIRLVILIGAGVVIGILTALGMISPLHFTNDSPWYVTALRGTPDQITFFLGGIGGLSIWLLFQPYMPKRWANASIWLCVSLIVVMAIQAIGLFRYSLKPGNPADTPEIVQAALWAKDNTAQDALFMDTVGDGSHFRFWSLRSVTSGWKELGLVGYSHPTDLAPMLERHLRIIAAAENESDLLAMADELDADYIIRDRDEPLDLPVVYENDELVIYQFTQ